MVQHDRTKYIEIGRHFITEKLDRGLIITLCVSTQNQLVDILTKGLICINFERITSIRCIVRYFIYLIFIFYL